MVKPLARVVGLAGASRRRRRRRARGRQRRPQPGPDRLDRGRADDRAHARHRRGRARRRHQGRRRSRRSRTSSTPTTSIDGKQGLPFRASEGDKLAATAGVKSASHVRSDTAIVQGKEQRDHRDRSGDDRATSTRSRGRRAPSAGARRARRGRRARHARTTPRTSSSSSAASCRSRRPRARSARSSSAASTTRRRPTSSWARVSMTQQAFDEAFGEPKNSYTFLDGGRRRRQGARGGREGLRRRGVPHGRRVPEGRHEGHGDGPGHALRAAGLLGDREPVRHGQHDGALGVRAHP